MLSEDRGQVDLPRGDLRTHTVPFTGPVYYLPTASMSAPSLRADAEPALREQSLNRPEEKREGINLGSGSVGFSLGSGCGFLGGAGTLLAGF